MSMSMIPVHKFKAWSIHRNRLEIWEAVSLDGKWHFERTEAPGTPWQVTHVDFPGWWIEFGTLAKARKFAERQLRFDLESLLATEQRERVHES